MPVHINPARTWTKLRNQRSPLLIAAPITQEFPTGDMHAPASKWVKVKTFETGPTCDLELEEAENHLQRPVQCMASDDPRILDSPPTAGP